MSAFRNCLKFRERTRERAANFVEFRCTAHAELGRRAPRALCNTHDGDTVPGKVSAAFGGDIARCRRFEIANNFARKRANVLQILLSFGALRMQNSAGVRRVRCATRTTVTQSLVKSVLRLAATLRDVGVSKSRKISRENARTYCNYLQILLKFGALRMQNSAGVRRVRCTTCTTLTHFSKKSVLRLAAIASHVRANLWYV